MLAYSTVSQLGYMFAAVGVGAYAAGVFHLMTHAFFKACLFLGAGSVIHAMSGEQDMFKMGALGKTMKTTMATFVVASITIAGIPPLAAFFSKDEILWNVFNAHVGPAWLAGLLWAMLFVGAGVTAFYIFRAVFLTFFGKRRYSDEAAHHLHESPSVMTIAADNSCRGIGPYWICRCPVDSWRLQIGSTIIWRRRLGLSPSAWSCGHVDAIADMGKRLVARRGSGAGADDGDGRRRTDRINSRFILMVMSVLVGVVGILLARHLYLKNPGSPAGSPKKPEASTTSYITNILSTKLTRKQ